MVSARDPVPLPRILEAQRRIEASVTRTPLVRLGVADTAAEIWLKLENLQPIGSFKLRGALNALLTADPDDLADGVYTASAGNMAQGLCWAARRLGVGCRVVVPDHAPRTKLDAIGRLGGEVVAVPFDTWWQVLLDGGLDGMRGRFVHPVSEPAVLAGNATIGVEIHEDLGAADAVVVPYGGGGLSCGIASALRELAPRTRVLASEVETAAPLAASLAAGEPRAVDYVESFVDGIGGKSVLPEMWPLARDLLVGSLVVSIAETAAAVRLLAERNRIIAEGAGATPVAAALAGKAGAGRIVCVVSGGNIDATTLATILSGRVPT